MACAFKPISFMPTSFKGVDNISICNNSTTSHLLLKNHFWPITRDTHRPLLLSIPLKSVNDHQLIQTYNLASPAANFRSLSISLWPPGSRSASPANFRGLKVVGCHGHKQWHVVKEIRVQNIKDLADRKKAKAQERELRLKKLKSLLKEDFSKGEQCLEQCLEQFLADDDAKAYLTGEEPTYTDIQVYTRLTMKPSPEFPIARKWYETITPLLSFNDDGRAISIIPNWRDLVVLKVRK